MLPELQKLKHKPYAHQLKALQLLREHDSFGLFMEMGTGKTKTLIDDAAISYWRGEINCLIVVALNDICEQWAHDQVPEHIPLDIKYKTLVWQHETQKFKKECQWLLQHDGLSILILNPEAILSDRCAGFVRKLLQQRDVMFAIDESTVIKNIKAKRTKLFIKLGQQAVKKRILTGSPIANSPLDIWAQFEFLGVPILGKSFINFRNRYAIVKKKMFNGRIVEVVDGYKNLDELQQRIAAKSYRVLLEQCVDMPPKIYHKRYVELAPEQQNYYNEMREYSMAQLQSGEVITAQIVLTLYLRLRQALANIAKTEEGLVKKICEKDRKIEAVINALSECNGQAIIWASFVASIENIAAEIERVFGRGSVTFITGEVERDERTEQIAKFKSGKTKYLVMNPKACGYGLNLQEATTVIYYDNDWSLVVRQQSESRAHRIGQTKPVNYIDIIVKNTIDERIAEALLKKDELAKHVTGDNLLRMLK